MASTAEEPADFVTLDSPLAAPDNRQRYLRGPPFLQSLHATQHGLYH